MFLVRDLVSARTWLAMTQHLAGLFIGLAVIFLVTFGLGFGFSFVFIGLIGIPILGVTLRLADWFAQAERARFGFMLGARIPAWPAPGSEGRAGYRWGVIPRWRVFTQGVTWAELGYALLRLPVSAVTLTISVAAWALGLVMLTLPAYAWAFPNGGATIGDTMLSAPELAAGVVVGVAVLLAAPQLTRGLAVADAAFSRLLLGPRSDLAASRSSANLALARPSSMASATSRC